MSPPRGPSSLTPPFMNVAPLTENIVGDAISNEASCAFM
jgi:hypothetical protein